MSDAPRSQRLRRGRRTKLFISYRRLPSAMLAQLLATKLKAQGIDAFVDTRQTDGAGPFPERLLRAIEDCDVFVCLVADQTFDSDWVRREIEHAHATGKPMIPVFQESYQPIRQPTHASVAALLQFDGIHVLDVKGVYVEESIVSLANMVRATLPKTSSRKLAAVLGAILLCSAVALATYFVMIPALTSAIMGMATATNAATSAVVLTQGSTATNSVPPTAVAAKLKTATSTIPPSRTSTSIPSSVVVTSPTNTQDGVQAFTIGVIGSSGGSSALGISLAINRMTARGPVNGPGGITFTPTILAIDAKSRQEITNAIKEFKRNNVVAIFGPDENELAEQSMDVLLAAGIPVFMGATATTLKSGGFIFRTRADSNRQMVGLADVLITDLHKAKFGIYQGNSGAASQVTEMVLALSKRGKTPVPPVIHAPGGTITDVVHVLLSSQPDTIVAFGDQAAELYRTLRVNGFTGIFVTPDAESQTFIQAIPETLRFGIYGFSNWSSSWNTPDSVAFTKDYAAMAGNTPTGLSAASYDAAIVLMVVASSEGSTPEALRTKILALPKVDAIQGTFNAKLGNGALSANVVIYSIDNKGVPQVIARFDETGRLSVVPQ